MLSSLLFPDNMVEYDPPKELQPPKNISNHYSITANLRQPNPIKQFYKYFQVRDGVVRDRS